MEIKNSYPLDSVRENIRTNAQNLRTSLDNYCATQKMADNYKQHLEDCITYPTTGRLARHQFVDRVHYNYDRDIIWRNEQIAINKDKQVRQLRKILTDVQTRLYKKTLKAREYIINDNRIDFSKVKKARGYNWLDRLQIVLTKIK